MNPRLAGSCQPHRPPTQHSLQAAILNVKLPHLEESGHATTRERRPVYEVAYRRWPRQSPRLAGNLFRLRTRLESIHHSHARGKRDVFVRVCRLWAWGARFTVALLPLHLQECFKNLGYREGDLPDKAPERSPQPANLPGIGATNSTMWSHRTGQDAVASCRHLRRLCRAPRLPHPPQNGGGRRVEA